MPHAQQPAGIALFTGRTCLVQVLSATSKQDQLAVACGLSEEPSDLLRDSLQHSIRGWEDLRAAPRGGRCRARAAVRRTSSRKRSAGAGCAAHVFRPVRPGLCQPAAARLLAFGEPGRRLGQPSGPRHRCWSAGTCRDACCCIDAACINPVRDLASCRLHGRGLREAPR